MGITLKYLEQIEVKGFILPEFYGMDTLDDLKELLQSHGFKTDPDKELELTVDSYFKNCPTF